MVPRILLFLLLSFGARAQSVITLISLENNQVIGEKAVVFLDSTSTVIYFTQTSVRGTFTLPDSLFVSNEEHVFFLKTPDFLTEQVRLRKYESRIIYLVSSVEELDEFVVTGQLSQRTSDQSVQKARIIDRAVIDAKGAVNLKDVLQSELNIRISQDQVLGSGMSLQGMNGQNIKILIDGVPIIGRLDGEIDLSQINLSTIERIEIIEGPSSVSFGSNALAGTINLITKKREKAGQQIQLNSYFETVGNYNLDGRFTTTIRKSQLQLFGQRNYFDGWINSDPFYDLPKEKIADSNRYQSWKPKLQYQAGIKWLIPIKRMTLTPYADYFHETIHNKGLPRAPYFNTAFDDYYRTERFNQGLIIDAPFNRKFKLQGVIAFNYYQRIKNTYLKNLNTLDQQLTLTAGDQDTTRFSSLMSRMSWVKHQKEDLFNYELGYDFTHETANGKRILDTHQTITEVALFSNCELEWKKLIIRPGLRYTYNSGYKSALTPALNLKYDVLKWIFRAGIANGFRSPTIKELYIDFVDINHTIQGNVQLKPEQSMHYQLWIETKRFIGKHSLFIDVNGYYQQVDQKIALAQSTLGTSYSYFNLANFEVIGFQSVIDFKPNKHQLKAGFAYVGSKSDLTTNGYAFSPEFTLTTSVLWKKPNIQFTAFYKYTGRVLTYLQTEDEEPIITFMNDYQMLDVNATRECWNKKIIVSIGAKNLFNVQQVGTENSTGTHTSSSTSTPIGWGRSVYIKLQVNLHSKK